MFAYIARQPIVDVNRDLFAYELLFRDGVKNCFPDISPDEATSRIIASSHLNLSLEEITGGVPAFINFHTNTLLHRFPTSLNKDLVVIEIIETVDLGDDLIDACSSIYDSGYKLALDDYDVNEKWQAIIPYASIVKFDITTVTLAQMEQSVPELKARGIKLVAERIETLEEFEQFKAMGFDYFQGYFFAKPEILRHRKLTTSKLAMLELMAVSTASNFDFNRVNEIIERDISLSYMFLRFINNPTVNKRHQITSLRHALTYMGEIEVKKFVSLVALANLSNDQPMELLQMSLVRAKFCEFVALALNDSGNPPVGFLTGLLSILDTLMQQDMSSLVEKIPLSDNVKVALCGGDNILKDCLQLVQYIEQANWQGLKRLANKLGLKQTLLHNFYTESIKWARAMQQSTVAK
jgi:EAL and modified HD-GYP domain-containing signal transduction protein